MDNHELTPEELTPEELRKQNEDLKREVFRLELNYAEKRTQLESLRARLDSFKNTPVSSSINNSYCKK